MEQLYVYKLTYDQKFNIVKNEFLVSFTKDTIKTMNKDYDSIRQPTEENKTKYLEIYNLISNFVNEQYDTQNNTSLLFLPQEKKIKDIEYKNIFSYTISRNKLDTYFNISKITNQECIKCIIFNFIEFYLLNEFKLFECCFHYTTRSDKKISLNIKLTDIKENLKLNFKNKLPFKNPKTTITIYNSNGQKTYS